MDRPHPFLTTPVAILLGCILISVSILLHGGVIKIGQPTTAMGNAGGYAAAPGTVVASPAPSTAPAPGTKVDVASGHFPVEGSDSAKITVVEFADFQCPFCEKWFTDVESSLMKDYVNTGKIKFAFRSYAFLGQESTWGSEAAECANEQGQFWPYHDYLYSHQGQENSGAFTKDKLEGFASTLNLNADQFKTCLESDKYAAQVKADFDDGQKAGVNGTPATFINGKQISGACSYETFKGAIEAELKGKTWSVNNCQLSS